MPWLEFTPNVVTIKMSFWDRLLAFHGDIAISRDRITASRTVPNARRAVRGRLGMPGTRLPGLILAGYIGSVTGGTTFAVAYGNGPGVVLDTTDPRFSRVVLSVAKPDAALAQLHSS